MTLRRPKMLVALIDPLALRRASIQSMLESASSEIAVSAFPSITGLMVDAGARDQVELVLLNLGSARAVDEALRETLDALAAELGPVPVVLLAEQTAFEEMVAAVRLGVRGVLTTSLEPAVAIQALWLVQAGGHFLPANAALDYFDGHPSNGQVEQWAKLESKVFDLTQREREVLVLIHEGKPNKIIAHELKLRQGTVKVYVRRLMRKLGVNNRTQVALLAHSLAGQVMGTGDPLQH
jgi:DNA-binding NarL/FixJ family response regulator